MVKRKLEPDEQEITPLRNHDELFPIGFAHMFKKTPMDTSSSETRRTILNFSPADQPGAKVFSAVQFGNGVGIHKINEAVISFDFKIVQGNGTDLQAGQNVLIAKRPAHSIWKQTSTKLNDRALGGQNPFGTYNNYFKDLVKSLEVDTKYDLELNLLRS